MKSKIFTLLFSFFCLITHPGYLDGSTSPDSKRDPPIELERILRESAAYCEKLTNSALFFVCKEKIEEEIHHIDFSEVEVWRPTGMRRVYRVRNPRPKAEKNTYIYDYQLIKKGTKIEESRILLQENEEKKYVKNSKLKTKRFYSKKSIFGPVGFLSKNWQETYNYKIKKEDTINGRMAIVIEALPKIKMKDKPNYGKIWVDKEDFSVLKIEIEAESLAGFENLKEMSRKRRIKPIITVVHDYGIEKKGIGFPSKIIFEESYIGPGTGKFRASRTIITYDEYRFFTVDVKVKH
jgi:hypothetical protein